jgi:hypothetical protein
VSSRRRRPRANSDREYAFDPARRSVLQAERRRRGGWNTSPARCTGQRAIVPAGRKEGRTEAKVGSIGHQGQESSRWSSPIAGTAGAAGCCEQNAPEQGRGREGTGISSDRPDGSPISGERRPGSVRDVTRWEQPPFATGGASNTNARRVMTAPAREETSCLKEKDLVILRVSLSMPPSNFGGKACGRGADAVDLPRANATLHGPRLICNCLVIVFLIRPKALSRTIG